MKHQKFMVNGLSLALLIFISLQYHLTEAYEYTGIKNFETDLYLYDLNDGSDNVQTARRNDYDKRQHWLRFDKDVKQTTQLCSNCPTRTYHQFKNIVTGKCLHSTDSSKRIPTRVKMDTCTDAKWVYGSSRTDWWWKTSTGDHSFFINLADDVTLDSDGKGYNYGKVYALGFNGGYNQQWYLIQQYSLN